MARRRKNNKHLPPYVYFRHNAYYYTDKNNNYKMIRLGSNIREAMEAWSKLVDDSAINSERITTMGKLFDKYLVEVAPKKSLKSYRSNILQMQTLRIFFGDMEPSTITPPHIYKFLDIRGETAKVGANREKALLSHVFTMAIRWGYLLDNPCKHVKRLPERPRDRYIEHYEYLAVRNIATEIIKNIMDFAYLTGQRIGDILQIKINDLTDEGIRIKQNKSGSKIIINWSDILRECVNKMKSIRHSNISSIYLFCNEKGQAYTSSGFSSMWQRTMKKAIENGVIEETFTFHDIRAKSSSDMENRVNASQLLGHSDIRITERVYNRKYKKVDPLR